MLDPGRKRTKLGFFWAVVSDDRGHGGSDPPIVMFHYAPGRGGEQGQARFLSVPRLARAKDATADSRSMRRGRTIGALGETEVSTKFVAALSPNGKPVHPPSTPSKRRHRSPPQHAN